MWRFSVDSLTGEVIGGDVGQGSREEIDNVMLGGNYGWNCREGNLPFAGCSGDFVEPLYAYPRTDGNSVTGGYVSRGLRLTALNGVYLYADYGSGRIWGLINGNYLGQYIDTTLRIVSFAEANNGDLYVMDLFTGDIYRIDLL